MKIDALSSAVILAFITAIFAYWRYTREQQHHRNTLLNALFGELANIYEHYTYNAFELPCNVENNNELKKRLSWSIWRTTFNKGCYSIWFFKCFRYQRTTPTRIKYQE